MNSWLDPKLDEVKFRSCLKCSRRFISYHRANRICAECNGSNAKSGAIYGRKVFVSPRKTKSGSSDAPVTDD